MQRVRLMQLAVAVVAGIIVIGIMGALVAGFSAVMR
jgi:hypothetical protein